MPKPDPALLDPARYPFRCELDTRFSDLDLNLHINNVAITDFLQETRARFHGIERFSGAAPRQPIMIANLSVDYLSEGLYGVPVVGYAGVLEIGRTSHVVGSLLVQGKDAIVFSRSVIVSMTDGKPAPPSPEFLDNLRAKRIRA